MRNLIREGKIHQIPGTMQVSQKDGMQTMDMALTNLVTRGMVTPRRGAIEKHEPESFRRAGGRRRRPVVETFRTRSRRARGNPGNVQKMVEIEASDLYLTVARPPMYRVEGKIQTHRRAEIHTGRDARTLAD